MAVLEVDQVSEPVTTDAGIRIIKLLDLQKQRSQVSINSVIVFWSFTRAQAEELVEILDSLADLVYNADNLDDAAEELGLNVSRAR